MRKLLYILFLLFCCVSSNLFLHAQLLSTEGKEFWVSFLKVNAIPSVFPRNMAVFITAKRPCTATLTSADGAFAQTVSVSPDSATTVNLTLPNFYNDESEVVTLKGIHIMASDTISVYAYNNYNFYSRDLTQMIPATSLGSEYIILDHADKTGSASSFTETQFLIIGVEDNTEVEINPTATSIGGTNTSSVITLNIGQTYRYASGSDLTGSRVRTRNCKKIAVFTGNVITQVPTNCGGAANLYEQNFPINTLGTTFLVTGTLTRGGDYLKIVATQNNTNIYFDNTLVVTLNAGDVYGSSLAKHLYIRSTKPVLVALMGVGQSCTSGKGNPFMVYVTPMEQAIQSSIFSPVFEYNMRRSFVNIHVRTIDKNQTFLDGKNIGNQFTPFPGNAQYSYARIEISRGTHTIKNEKKFTAYVYGHDDFTSYGYSAGSMLNKSEQFALINGISSNLQKEFYFCPMEPVTFEAVTQDTLFSEISWQFSDGTTQNGRSVTKAFSNPGCFDVKMVTSYFGSSGRCRLADDDITNMKVCVVNSLPLSLGRDTGFCKGDSLQLSSNINPEGFSYIWNTGESTSSVSVNKTGDYWLELRNGNCAIRDSVKVAVTDKPVLHLGVKQFLCVNDSLLLKNSVNEAGVTYTWNNGAVGYSQWVNEPGVYKLYASSGGCTNEDSVKVELMSCPDIYVPTAFTPNSDGLNDVIRPIVAGMELQYFRIYDRWGNLVFETKERLKGWNGNRGNIAQPTGAYVYVAEAKDNNGKLYLKKGTFVLIR